MNITYLYPDRMVDADPLRPGPDIDCASVQTQAHQFEMDLGDKVMRQLRIAVTDTIHGRRLTTLVDELTPEFVIDLRSVLRFDLPGMSRDVFFQRLSMRGVHYARAPIAWREVSSFGVTAETRLPTRLHHEAVERWDRNLILLVSRPEHAVHAHAMLNMVLSIHRPTGWIIERVF